ncbi:hypothetical protein M0802_011921 [Mischocyttarus mexicanus]|nr:hypothetical protein M0802_011921 [Mischocyttarus mexicanus]
MENLGKTWPEDKKRKKKSKKKKKKKMTTTRTTRTTRTTIVYNIILRPSNPELYRMASTLYGHQTAGRDIVDFGQGRNRSLEKEAGGQ